MPLKKLFVPTLRRRNAHQDAPASRPDSTQERRNEKTPALSAGGEHGCSPVRGRVTLEKGGESGKIDLIFRIEQNPIGLSKES